MSVSQRIDVQLSRDHYTADAVIVWCLDHRFWPALEALIEERGFKSWDLVDIAGGIKDIASPDAEYERRHVLEQIVKCCTLHAPQRVILMTHTDCGGYGGPTFDSEEEEAAFYERELAKAAEQVREALDKNGYGDTVVERCVVDFEGISFLA